MAYHIVKLGEELSAGLSALIWGELEAEIASSCNTLDHPLPDMAPTWKVKQAQNGSQTTVKNSNFGIGRPRDAERSVRIVVGTIGDEVARYRDAITDW